MSDAAPTLSDLGIGLLFDLVPDPVVVGDMRTGRIIGWNVAASQVFGYSRADAIGMPLDLLVPDELRDAHRAGVATFSAGGGGHLVDAKDLVEVPALRADGRRISVELHLSTLDAVIGSRQYVLAVLRDVTSRRAAQDETERALERVRSANAALHDFVEVLAHDLRSPLAGVSAALDLLEQRWDRLTEDQRVQILDMGRRQTGVALALLNSLMELSTIESGQLAPSPQPVELLTAAQAAAESAGTQVHVEVPTTLTVHADPTHVHRVLMNLISNSVKYGAPPITVTARRAGAAVEVCVADRGPGVPEDLQARLFEKFSRGSQTSTSQPGNGLGLAIVAGLMAAADGAARYETAADGSSCFVVSWPAASLQPTAPAPHPA